MTEKSLRQLIVTVVGHVDHGKTSILDSIRDTSVASSEAGLITQHISCTNIPFEVIEKFCKNQTQKIKIPGLLFLDTPGHASFTNLRKRGGNLADIAILVVDLNEGFKPQTIESIEILKQYKTPFIIAANKIDLISGWQKKQDPILKTISQQTEAIQEELNKKLYDLVSELSKYGINAERFDKVDNYTKQIAIIPCSAKTKTGLPELLMVLAGLAQKFLEKSLEINITKPGKGIVLEIKEEKGLGTTLDVILHDGCIKKNDQIVIGSLKSPIVTKIKGLFEPNLKNKLTPVNKVNAAIGVKINAPNTEEVIAGMPLQVANKNLEEIKKEIQKEIQEVIIETDKEGIIIKTDSLGSLEALSNLLKEKSIQIRKATIGNITKTDIAEASSAEDPLKKVILGFNVTAPETKEVKLITSDVIYKILEDFESWKQSEIKKQEEEKLKGLTLPGKIHFIPGTVFRQSNPSVFGIEVLAGKISIDSSLINEKGDQIGKIKSIQIEGENITQAETGKECAIAVQGVTIGRQLFEGEILYISIPEDDFRKLKEMKSLLNVAEVQILKEIATIKRKENPLWGV